MSFTWPLGKAESQLEFYDLSHPWGHGVPAWPYFEDVKIERLHGMAKSRVLTQKITTVMHSGTHIDAPAHVVEGTPFLDEIPLSAFFGTGVVVSIPKQKWGVVTAEDLENASSSGPEIRAGDIVIVNTGWHHKYADSAEYYAYSPGFYKEAGEWFAAKGVKAVGTDTQALDHPLGTAIAPHGPAEHLGGMLPWAVKRIRGGDRPQGARRFPGVGAVPPGDPVQGHLRIRERRRRFGQGHRQARHLRRVPVALGWRRRLHRAAGRDRRPLRYLPHRDGSGGVTMNVTRVSEAPVYRAALHRDVCTIRLQGHEAGDTERFWVGVSLYKPGGSAEEAPARDETVYVVLDGELVVTCRGQRNGVGPARQCAFRQG